MQDGHRRWVRHGQFVPQQLGEKVVVSVPLAVLVQRYEKQVVALDLGKQCRGICAIRDAVAQLSAQPVEDGCLQQELA
jgi:hypothetical protein